MGTIRSQNIKLGKGSASVESVAAKKVLEDMIQDGTRIGMFVSDRCSNIAWKGYKR